MATSIPAALKSADIGRYAVRAAQLEKAKPIVAYWCNFYIVNQIIEKGLHTTDDEIKLYTVDLMEKLEQFKTENPDNDAILDSMAASAYVEEFGLEIFGRAEAAMRADKVTKQTADTFQAAATILELCQIWNPLDPEVAAKVKFAKYHAVRIVKAIKAGEDPNATNPKIEEEVEQPEDLPQELPNGFDSTNASSSQALQPRVEDVPDEYQHAQPLDSPPILPQPPTAFTELPSAPQGPASASYRPVDDREEDSPLNLPSAPDTFAAPPTLPDTPTKIGGHHQPKPSNEFQSFPPPPAISPPSPTASSHDAGSFYNTPSTADSSRFVPPAGPGRVSSYSSHQSIPFSTPTAVAPPTAAMVNPQNIDDQAIALAQKHARWAVSALAFEDVDTAIKELRNSLKQLGAE